MNQLEQIQLLEQRLYQAQLSSDLTELDALLSDELLGVGPDGQMITKMDDLDAHRAGIINIHSMQPRETSIKLLPEVAIVFVLMDMQVTFRGEPFAGLCRYTRVWSHQRGKWQIVAAHISLVPT